MLNRLLRIDDLILLQCAALSSRSKTGSSSTCNIMKRQIKLNPVLKDICISSPTINWIFYPINFHKFWQTVPIEIPKNHFPFEREEKFENLFGTRDALDPIATSWDEQGWKSMLADRPLGVASFFRPNSAGRGIKGKAGSGGERQDRWADK